MVVLELLKMPEKYSFQLILFWNPAVLQLFVTNLAVKVGEMTTEAKIFTIAILQRSAAEPTKESDLVLI